MELFIIGIMSYLMGSIPFGLILTKIFLKKDIREIGSGNIGATNALRTGSKLLAFLVLFLDAFKSFFIIKVFKFFDYSKDLDIKKITNQETQKIRPKKMLIANNIPT